MAVGFKLSSVIKVEVFQEEKTIRFTTRAVVYEIVIDDWDRKDEIIKAFKDIIPDPPQPEKPKPKKKFYLEK